ncbi:hypothetical protein QTI66_07035 [Variovorax sp. J22R133]|uniref:hypothetical protein n=1 Tax=Variovorax brevis TaxID=3053503 RepID=UPI002577F4F1|nr:hypothetical protein [Variovorax sp. J22R133]MDM0111896.1 hypothetical protein [Variovorax sp. J22R133]
MTTQTISTAAVHVVGQYNDAAKTLVSAYRSGVQRVLSTATTRYSAFVTDAKLPLVSESIKARLIEAEQKANGFLAGRLDIDTGRVVRAMDRVATAATTGIETVATKAAAIESARVASVISKFNELNMPIANISVKIADKVAAGAKQIETRLAAATDAAVEVAEEAAKPVRRIRAAKKSA